MMLVGFGTLTLFMSCYAWWIARQLSTLFLRQMSQVCCVVIFGLGLGFIGLGVERTRLEAFEIPISHRPLQEVGF
jgi:hypothetical protein